MTQLWLMIELVTEAPSSTTTPRDRIELRTVPLMMQPAEMIELHAWLPVA